jgi:hypothetical protein
MPYLDLADYDQYAHLVQLFLAAHPAHREMNDQVRVQEGRPAEYFLTSDMLREMAAWALGRHLITRKAAARLAEVGRGVFATPQDIIALTPRLLGNPPRLQPTVLSTEMQHWITLREPEVVREVLVLTIPAAIGLLSAMTTDPAWSAVEHERARILRAWLETQGEGV